MPLNYLKPEVRKAIVDQIDNNENKQRKQISLGQYEIFRDRLLSQVTAYLSTFNSANTMKQMPIYAAINLARRIVKKEASIYKSAPERTFIGLSKDQEEVVRRVYEDIKANSMLMRANEFYKLQEQNHLYLIPVGKKLKLKTLLSHQIDSIPSMIDPEIAEAYLISGFDKSNYIYSDGTNEVIGDIDDYKSTTKRFALWSEQFNFLMNEQADITSGENVENNLNMIPIVDIASHKDNEYWVRCGCSLTDFTIQYNAANSDLGMIVRMQGFSQAIVKGHPDMIPKEMEIGPAKIIKLGIDPNNQVETDFQFASPSPDLAGSLQFLENLLSAFLTSRGLDPSTVNGKGSAEKYSSGLERLLAMIEMFEPAKEDFDVFQDVEKRLFKLIVRYLNTYANTEVLEYKCSKINEDNVDVIVKFAEPQAVVSETERLDNISRKYEMGAMTDVEKISEVRKVTLDKAQTIYNEINADTGVSSDANKLNGAQVASLISIVEKVALGTLPREAGVNMIAIAFGLDTLQASDVLAAAGAGFKVTPEQLQTANKLTSGSNG